MIRTAPKSSIIAKDSRNIFKPIGTLSPMIRRIARENAISVAVGMAQPTKFC